MKVICITGKMGSGKTTLANAIMREFRGASAVIKFADPLYGIQKVIYDYITAYYDMPGLEKGAKDRKLLQFLGTEWGQERFGPTIWADVWKRRIERLEIGITLNDDLRFPHELTAAQQIGAITIRLECPENIRAARIGKNFGGTMHPSETALDGVSNNAFTFVFDTAEQKVDEIIAELRRSGVLSGEE
jgi:hypothetical protein